MSTSKPAKSPVTKKSAAANTGAAFRNNVAPTAMTAEETEEKTETAISAVDSEFGRATDPTRMYMREMDVVEQLTRQDAIVKRIESGLMDAMEAIGASPAVIAEILAMAEEIREGKAVVSAIVDGFSSPNETDGNVAEENFDEKFDKEEGDDGKDGSKVLTHRREELKNEVLRRFDTLKSLLDQLHIIYARKGYGSPEYLRVQGEISSELMTIRFTAKIIEKLCDLVRTQVDDVRKKSVNCAALLWMNAACRKNYSLKTLCPVC